MTEYNFIKRLYKYSITIFIIVFIINLSSCWADNTIAPKAKKGVLDLSNWDFEKQGTVKLDGEWEVYWDSLIEPFELKTYNEKKSYILLPSKEIQSASNSHATLRLKLYLPKDYRLYALKTELIFSSYKIWINDNLVSSVGTVATSKERQKPEYVVTNPAFPNKEGYNEIVINAANFYDRENVINSIIVGTYDQMMRMTKIKVASDIFVFGSLLIMGIYHIALYSQRINEKSALYFGLLCILVAVRTCIIGERFLVQLISNLPFEVYVKLGYLSFYIGVPLFALYLDNVFCNYLDKKVIKCTIYLGAILSLVTLFTTVNIYDIPLNAFMIYSLILIIYVLNILIKASINKNYNAFIALCGFIVILITIINDMLHSNKIIRTAYLLQYGILCFVFSQSYLLARSFSKAFYDVERLANENSIMNKEILELNSSLEKKVIDRTIELQKKNHEIKNLLDNAGQGFLYFGDDLLIKSIYSSECLSIFEMQSIENCRLSKLIYKDHKKREFMDNVLLKVFLENDLTKMEVFLSLICGEVMIGDKYVKLDYKVVSSILKNDTIMVVITDITEKKLLEIEVEKDRTMLKMVVKCITNQEDVRECVAAYYDFCNIIENHDANNNSFDQIISELFMDIHTFKGSFALFEFTNIVDKLHKLESLITEIKEDEKNNDTAWLLNFLRIQKIDTWLCEDIEIINNYLGSDFIEKKDFITIEKKKLIEIENQLEKHFEGAELYNLLIQIKRFRYKNFKDLLKTYPEYVEQLASRMGKTISPFRIEGDDIFVDIDIYKDFTRSLVHIIRNLIDHGIESEDERIESGKTEFGCIKCAVYLKDNCILLTLSDDGRGIDLDAVKRSAVEKGYYNSVDIEKINKDEIISLIFKQSISTKKVISLISGRGVGLYSVKKEVDKLGGKIKIRTEKGMGTEFIFKIPVRDKRDAGTGTMLSG